MLSGAFEQGGLEKKKKGMGGGAQYYRVVVCTSLCTSIRAHKTIFLRMRECVNIPPGSGTRIRREEKLKVLKHIPTGRCVST